MLKFCSSRKYEVTSPSLRGRNGFGTNEVVLGLPQRKSLRKRLSFKKKNKQKSTKKLLSWA